MTAKSVLMRPRARAPTCSPCYATEPINQLTGKYCVKLTENLRNTSQTTNET